MILKNRIYWVLGLVALLALTGAAVTATSRFAFAGGSDDDQPITGQALDKASEAALAQTGGGRVTATEVGDEDSYYQVEVTVEDGSQVDVQLDENFNIVSQNADDERADDQNGAKDDEGQLGDQNAAENGAEADNASTDTVVPCSDPTGTDDAAEQANAGPDTDNIEEQCGDQNAADDDVDGAAKEADTDNVEEQSGDQNAAENGDATAPSGTLDDGKDLLPQAGITIDQAIAAAQSAASGSVGEIDLEQYQGKLVFNVDVGDKDVKVDASNGTVLTADLND